MYNSLVEFLNYLQKISNVRVPSSYRPRTAISEDSDFIGFQPLAVHIDALDFARPNDFGFAVETELRVKNIIYLANAICNHVILPISVRVRTDLYEFTLLEADFAASGKPSHLHQAPLHPYDEDDGDDVVVFKGRRRDNKK